MSGTYTIGDQAQALTGYAKDKVTEYRRLRGDEAFETEFNAYRNGKDGNPLSGWNDPPAQAMRAQAVAGAAGVGRAG